MKSNKSMPGDFFPYRQKFVLSLLALSFALQIGFIYYLTSQEDYVATINMAGQQRMLSQRVAFSANAMLLSSVNRHRDDYLKIMKAAVNKMQSNYQDLISGNTEKGIVSFNTKALKDLYYSPPFMLDEHMNDFFKLCYKIIADEEQGKLIAESKEIKLLNELATHELLQKLEAAVWQYQLEAQNLEQTHDRIKYAILAFILISFAIATFEFSSFIKRINHDRKELELNKFVFDYSIDGIITADGDGRILTANERVRDMIGYSSGSIIGRKLSSLISEVSIHESIINEMQDSTKRTGEWRGEIIQRGDDAKSLSLGIQAVYADTLDISNYVLILTDISEQKENEDKFRVLSMHDQLTGLLNRNSLYHEYESLSAIAEREQYKLNVMMMDLDGFKQANDTHGHEAGDYVLIELSKRLEEVLRNSDVLARFGGDEFIALTLQGSGENHPEKIAEKILKAVCPPIHWKGNDINIGISIGVACYPECGGNLDELIACADEEMYKVKQNGKNNYSICAGKQTAGLGI